MKVYLDQCRTAEYLWFREKIHAMNPVPVLIMGAGPAAWSLAAAVAIRGVAVTLIAPEPDGVWPQTYGMWTDQWTATIAELANTTDPWRHRWDRVVAIGRKEQEVGRSYGILDNEKVLHGFGATAGRSDLLTVQTGSVVGVDSETAGSSVYLAGGLCLKARLVFDGTGPASDFVRRDSGSSKPGAFQTAFGRMVRARSVPFDDKTCVLMDWRGHDRRDASFLYALPFGDGTWLFEETSLARRGGLPGEELRTRLQNRLTDLGVEVEEELGSEDVWFPMNVPPPSTSQQTVAIGAAAALVHPATGYSVAASLRTATTLADSVVATVGEPVDVAARACWEVMWSGERRKARRLEAYGLERLLTMNQADTRSFFDTFFDLPGSMTDTYLSGEATAKELRSVMWSVFRRAPLRLQRCLAGGNPITLARSLRD